MNDSVVIKSFPHGISLMLSKDTPIEDLLRDVCYKFASSRKFFGESNLVLDIDGRDLSDDELLAVIQSVEYNSDIKITIVNINNRTIDTRFIRMDEKAKEEYIDNNAKIIYKFLPDELEVFSDSSVVVLGNVPEEYTIKAIGNIIVTGALYGSAFAGYPGRNKCIIAAGMMEANELNIGGEEYIPEKKSLFSGIRRPKGAVILSYSDGDFLLSEFGDLDILKHLK
jgi:septum site-determining protein MinC